MTASCLQERDPQRRLLRSRIQLRVLATDDGNHRRERDAGEQPHFERRHPQGLPPVPRLLHLEDFHGDDVKDERKRDQEDKADELDQPKLRQTQCAGIALEWAREEEHSNADQRHHDDRRR